MSDGYFHNQFPWFALVQTTRLLFDFRFHGQPVTSNEFEFESKIWPFLLHVKEYCQREWPINDIASLFNHSPPRQSHSKTMPSPIASITF